VSAPHPEDVWRAEWPHVLGALLRRSSAGLADCEDAVQEAMLAAAGQWPRDGVPDRPRAWLVRVASRRLVDGQRSDGARRRREAADATARRLDDDVAAPGPPGRDDSLLLVLLCCHPALSRPSQVALTLRAVAGLSTEEIAAGFLVPPSTMAQRLSRARATLRDAGATFEPPAAEALPARVAAVLDVCHLVFNEGYTRTGGADLVSVDLAEEAIRLTRLLHGVLPDHDEAAGALALMLLTHARTPARVDGHGDLVPLRDQDRTLWRGDLVAEGTAILERVLPRGYVGRYQLQAAIAAVHAEATSWQDTDWPQIVELYAMLDAVAPGPAVTLNRAVAVAMTAGPRTGLAMVDALVADHPAMVRHHRVHAVRAHLLAELGEPDAAADEFRRAAALTASLPEQRYLLARASARG
jgi:RNA polymerase sigma factor (sigma-70 family)